MSLATHESVASKGAVRFDVVPLSQHIGAEIRGIDLREDLFGAADRTRAQGRQPERYAQDCKTHTTRSLELSKACSALRARSRQVVPSIPQSKYS